MLRPIVVAAVLAGAVVLGVGTPGHAFVSPIPGDIRAAVASPPHLQAPATRSARKLMDRIAWLDDHVEDTRYQARTVVRRREGTFRWDCSGMMNWLLKRTAPKALAALDRERPVAATYVRVIRKASTRRARSGWRRVAHIEDVRPGDIFAWRRPPDFPSKSTGHVGVVLAAPRQLAHFPEAYKIRIADASSYTHEDDTRDPDGDGGYGHGTILFLTDGTGKGVAYGWYGNETGLIETPIYFGRVSR